MTFDDAMAYALTLSDTERGTHYGHPAVKIISNGRAFLSPGHEPDESFCLSMDRDTIEIVKETDPETFYQTPHYIGWDAMLVRYDSPDAARVREMIARAHDYAAAKKPRKPRRT